MTDPVKFSIDIQASHPGNETITFNPDSYAVTVEGKAVATDYDPITHNVSFKADGKTITLKTEYDNSGVCYRNPFEQEDGDASKGLKPALKATPKYVAEVSTPSTVILPLEVEARYGPQSVTEPTIQTYKPVN